MNMEEYVKRLKNQEITRYLLTIILDNINYVIEKNKKQLEELEKKELTNNSLFIYGFKMLLLSEAFVFGFIFMLYYVFNANIDLISFIGLQIAALIFMYVMIKSEKDVQKYQVDKILDAREKLIKKYGLGIEDLISTLNKQNQELKIRKEIIEVKLKKSNKTLRLMYNENIIPIKYRNFVALIKFDMCFKKKQDSSLKEMIDEYDKEKVSYRFTGKLHLLKDVAIAEKYHQPTVYFYVMRIYNMANEYTENISSLFLEKKIEVFEECLDDLLENKIYFEELIDINAKEVI